jgi:hypothetical protein
MDVLGGCSLQLDSFELRKLVSQCLSVGLPNVLPTPEEEDFAHFTTPKTSSPDGQSWHVRVLGINMDLGDSFFFFGAI